MAANVALNNTISGESMFKRLLSVVVLAATIIACGNSQVTDQQFADLMKKYLTTEKGQTDVGEAMQTYFGKLQRKAAEDQEAAAKEEMEKQFKTPLKVNVEGAPSKGAENAKSH